ncbi:MAG TPA: rRNA maturation RNase YbeY [Patescibacteria group bacterium]|uniref:rRNA maturation RNase YbeY n=1 Tax=Candidatus Woesebacteria bacterium RBG_13_46_13 TaxID=1802479 RepID=A0A1F7X4H3_9BACT|nr:MAG: rRNA maturation RNase YbeY [Candidatus Woesebacteria bacterium RBG_13_46_13]HJX59475.1 rRNA maturation RNase YbeY [Patescibacteria group bacterium]
MIKINVKKQSSYPVSTSKLRAALKDFFKGQGIVSDAEVSVAIVGEARMLSLGKKYLKESSRVAHDVLSFTQEEVRGKFIYPPDGLIHLGEIVICYPRVVATAKKEGKLIDEVVIELAVHSALHLMGVHHE